MTEMMFATSNYRRTVFGALLDARRVHGGRHVIVEDVERVPLTYNQLLVRVLLLGGLSRTTRAAARSSASCCRTRLPCVATLFGLQRYGRVPAMLNYTLGAKSLLAACQAAQIRRIYTSERFVVAAKLERIVDKLREVATVVYLEDCARRYAVAEDQGRRRERFAVSSLFAPTRRARRARDRAVHVGLGRHAEGRRAVARQRAREPRADAARIDFSSQDMILNALPMFHSFGLTIGRCCRSCPACARSSIRRRCTIASFPKSPTT